jgi:hypothetical protein
MLSTRFTVRSKMRRTKVRKMGRRIPQGGNNGQHHISPRVTTSQNSGRLSWPRSNGPVGSKGQEDHARRKEKMMGRGVGYVFQGF